MVPLGSSIAARVQRGRRGPERTGSIVSSREAEKQRSREAEKHVRTWDGIGLFSVWAARAWNGWLAVRSASQLVGSYLVSLFRPTPSCYNGHIGLLLARLVPPIGDFSHTQITISALHMATRRPGPTVEIFGNPRPRTSNASSRQIRHGIRDAGILV